MIFAHKYETSGAVEIKKRRNSFLRDLDIQIQPGGAVNTGYSLEGKDFW